MAGEAAGHHEPRVVRAGDVELHYVAAGDPARPPLVLVHGGGHDWRHWRKHLPHFAERWHVVAYSRRYAEPNRNDTLAPDYSAKSDARDLLALLDALGLARVHLVAHSIGAVAALFLATGHPDRVDRLVVAEPPVLRWIRGMPGGEAMWQRFEARMWRPAAERFHAGDAEGAMRIITDSFAGEGTFDRLHERSRRRVLENARDWEAFQRSTDSFPELPRERVRALDRPVLMLSAERTIPAHRMVDDELERLLPRVERVRIADASHDMWVDQPEATRAAALAFLSRPDAELP